MEILLEHKMPVNLLSRTGYTALHEAAANAPEDMVNMLIKHVANYDAEVPHGLTPLYFAARRGDKMICRLLYEQSSAEGSKSLNIHLCYGRLQQTAILTL
jgi:ankyrin repeat protein